jgi:hypothetical protein
MIPVDDAKPFSEESVSENRIVQSLLYATKGMNWFFPAALMILWLAVVFNSWPGVLLALGVGVLATLSCGPPQIAFAGYGYSTLNPGVFPTFSGMVGGLIGGLIDRARDTRGNSKLNLNYILAIIGLIIGFGIGAVWYIRSTP